MRFLPALLTGVSVLFSSMLLGATTAELITKHAQSNNLNPKVVESVIFVESSGNTFALGKDSVGDGVSIGLMQVKRDSMAVLGYRGTAKQLHDPEINIKYGTMYLRLMCKMFRSWPRSLDAYNRGPGAVLRSPYKGKWSEHKYVGKVVKKYGSLGGSLEGIMGGCQ